MAYAVAADVTARWARDATTEEIALIDVRLEDVERKIKRTIPDLDQQIVDGDILEADVVQVEADAVLRLARNPEGYLSESDGSYTYQLRHDLAVGRLTIMADEWEALGVTRTFTLIIPSPAIPQ